METEIEKLKRWLERDQAAMKELRNVNSRLRHEASHFKAERNKMNSRYDTLLATVERHLPEALGQQSKCPDNAG